MTHSTPPSFFRCVLLALAALLLPLQAAFATRGVAFHHNRPATITEGTRVTTYGYDKAGRAVLMTAGNGQTTNNTHDALGRLTDRTLFQTPAMLETEVLVQLGWDHDAAGNVLAQHETWPGSPARPAGIRSTLMGYDDNYRLTSETIQTRADAQSQPVTQSTTTYTYNDANNRVTKTVTGGTQPGHWTYHSNEANQLETWTQHDAPAGTLIRSAALTYDANGNRETQAITEGATTSTTTYSWDALDRLTGVEMPDGTTHSYAYDHRTRRHGITRSGGSLPPHQTLLTFTGGLSAAEWEAEDATPDIINDPATVEYQRGPDMGGGVGGLLYTRRGDFQSPTVRYNLSNGRGDIIAQSDAAATITWTASYEAGGKRPVETGTNSDKQRGNSKDEDPTGLLNENLRYRELEHMVWLSRDPAGFVDGLNLYAHVRQNPWTGFDPLGLKTKADYERQHDHAEQSYEAIKNKMADGEGTFGDLVKAGIYQASMKQNKEAISRIESTAKHLNEIWGNNEFQFDSNRLDDEKHSALFQMWQPTAAQTVSRLKIVAAPAPRYFTVH